MQQHVMKSGRVNLNKFDNSYNLKDETLTASKEERNSRNDSRRVARHISPQKSDPHHCTCIFGEPPRHVPRYSPFLSLFKKLNPLQRQPTNNQKYKTQELADTWFNFVHFHFLCIDGENSISI